MEQQFGLDYTSKTDATNVNANCELIDVQVSEISRECSTQHFDRFRSIEFTVGKEVNSGSTLTSRYSECHSNCGSGQLMRAVLRTGLWSSRGTYATVQAVLLSGHLTAEQVGCAAWLSSDSRACRL